MKKRLRTEQEIHDVLFLSDIHDLRFEFLLGKLTSLTLGLVDGREIEFSPLYRGKIGMVELQVWDHGVPDYEEESE